MSRLVNREQDFIGRGSLYYRGRVCVKGFGNYARYLGASGTIDNLVDLTYYSNCGIIRYERLINHGYWRSIWQWNSATRLGTFVF